MNRGPFGLLALIAFFAVSALNVIIASGPKGWITLGVVAALVGVALWQNRERKAE